MKSQSSQLVSLLLLLLILGGGFFFIRPLNEAKGLAQADADAKALELETLQSEYDELKALSDEVAKSAAKKEALLAAVPVGPAQDDLILDLTKLTAELGYDVNAINFAMQADPNLGNTISITANFVGSYDDLIGFLQKLENASRLFSVSSISVQKTSTTDVVFNLNIKAYYQ